MLKLKKNKKSQLYIITALFLCSLVFLLNAKTEKTEENAIDFESIYDNFITESKHVVNSAIYLNRNVSGDFSNFADEFITFAGTEGVTLHLFYGIVYDDKIYLANKFDDTVNITAGSAAGTINFILTDDNQSSITRQNWLNARVDGRDYLFNTSMNITEIKAVMKMSHEDKIEVRRYG